MAEDVVGLRFVSEGLPEALAGLGQYHQAIQRVGTQQKTAAQASGTSAQATQRTTTATRQATKAEADWFKVQRQRVAIMRGSDAIAARQAREAERLSRALATTATATNVATTAQMRLRQSFLQTANSIAILDGPLGGIASRFSAFGVLIGRAGFIMAGFLVTTALLGTVIGRGIRAFTEWEAQSARMNAVLTTTGHQVGLTTSQIENMASRIALATLESEQGVRAAATRLLTFGGIAGDVFEDVLHAASDMAALGFGTIESEAVKLAKALEDPAQALTSLSRAGIVFTRQQRALIISLVESGREAEAMERILANVNARVGGAAEAAAAGTLAGAFDTIGQAASRAVRDIGAFVSRSVGLSAVMQSAAGALGGYAAGAGTLAEQLSAAERALAALQSGSRLPSDLMDAMLRATPVVGNMLANVMGGRQSEDGLEDMIRMLREAISLEEQRAAAARAGRMTSTLREGVDSLREETALTRELIGLSEAEQRVQRQMGDLRLRNRDIERETTELRRQMAEAGVTDYALLDAAVDAHRRKLEEIAVVSAEALETARLADTDRTMRQNLANLEQQNALTLIQLGYMQQGVAAAEARRQAEEDIALRMATTILNAEGVSQAARDAAMAQVDAVLHAQDLRNAMEEVQARADMTAQLTSTIDGLDEQNEILAEQLRLLDEGVEFSESLRRAEVNLAIQRANTLAITASTTEEMERQLAIASALAQSFEENVRLTAAIETRRPTRARGGGGGRQRREVTLEGLVEDRSREIAQARELLQLSEQERLAAEIRFDLVNRLRQANVEYSEAAVSAAANRLAAEQQLNDELERQAEIRDQLAGAFANLFTAGVRGADAFRNALSNLASQLASMLAMRGMQNLLSMLMPTGSPIMSAIGSLAGGVKPAAKGMALQGGNVIPFASGGVIGSPTFFPMAGNNTGLMGEAGPEAIMPLRRGKGGKLGVASAPQNVNVTVDVRGYMDDNGNWKLQTEHIADSRIRRQAPAIASAARNSTLEVLREVGPGRIR